MKAEKTSAGTWRVRVYVGEVDGKQKFVSVTKRTKREAEIAAARIKILKPAPSETLTMRDAYAKYIEVKAAVLSPATVREYVHESQRSFQDLMPKHLMTLTSPEIQASLSEYAEDHSPKSVRNAYGLLSAVLKMYRPGFAPQVHLPQAEKKDIIVPTDEEIKRIHEAVYGTKLEIPFLLGAFGPMRRSEIAAARLSDLNGCTLRVDKALVKDRDSEWTVKQPKTMNGYRDIELPQFVADRIREVCDDYMSEYNPNGITHAFRKVVLELDMPEIHFHSLRHYCASYLHALGIPDEYICERGGWDVQSLQRIYRHAMPDKKSRESAKANAAFDALLKKT